MGTYKIKKIGLKKEVDLCSTLPLPLSNCIILGKLLKLNLSDSVSSGIKQILKNKNTYLRDKDFVMTQKFSIYHERLTYNKCS